MRVKTATVAVTEVSVRAGGVMGCRVLTCDTSGRRSTARVPEGSNEDKGRETATAAVTTVVTLWDLA
jgi:hypothetical protein